MQLHLFEDQAVFSCRPRRRLHPLPEPKRGRRRASSGSTLSLRARFTTENSRSPTSAASLSGSPPAAISSAISAVSSSTLAITSGAFSQSKPTAAARCCTFWARRVEGKADGTSWKMPSRPSDSRLMASQVRRTSSGVSAWASPKMCGWRRTSLAWMPAATSPRSYRPSSSATLARKYTWKSRSPSSPRTGVVATGRPLVDGVGQLVGLLQGIGDDGLLSLLAVPGTFAPEPDGEVVQAAKLEDDRRRASSAGPPHALALWSAVAVRWYRSSRAVPVVPGGRARPDVVVVPGLPRRWRTPTCTPRRARPPCSCSQASQVAACASARSELRIFSFTWS